MPRVKQFLQQREHTEVFAVRDDWSVLDVVRYMSERKIGAVGVVDASHRLVGIFSERDLAKRVVLNGRDPVTCPVRDVMTHDLIVVETEDTLQGCRARMDQAKIRHLAIVDGQTFLGLISMRDLTRMELGEHRETIRYLTDYMFFAPENGV